MPMISERFHQTKTQIRDDGAAIKAAQSDPRKFEPLYTKYYKQILEFVYLRLDSLQEAYDVTSEVFLRALEKLPDYEHRGLPFSSWLYRVAMNELNQHFRKSKKFRAINIETSGVARILHEADSSDHDADIARMIECMKRLASADYLLIEMRFFESRSFKEIGEILEITENNAKVRTYRAVGKLKRIF
jgi:RNA polymerase sigma-70 factor, ECF subfamily